MWLIYGFFWGGQTEKVLSITFNKDFGHLIMESTQTNTVHMIQLLR